MGVWIQSDPVMGAGTEEGTGGLAGAELLAGELMVLMAASSCS